ncbi:hypothetical protein [Ruania zhangjianzhongii]|uniref:hypothetical protein n=1 Tax=Ruania zhangjianzhongii TaxID=2603206 RepID=UPI0011C7BAC4|nr:hypothetical protein [Ruania zhangjianzhongii]
MTIRAQIGVDRVGIGAFAGSVCVDLLGRPLLLLGLLGQAVCFASRLFGLELGPICLSLGFLGCHLTLACG